MPCGVGEPPLHRGADSLIFSHTLSFEKVERRSCSCLFCWCAEHVFDSLEVKVLWPTPPVVGEGLANSKDVTGTAICLKEACSKWGAEGVEPDRRGERRATGQTVRKLVSIKFAVNPPIVRARWEILRDG